MENWDAPVIISTLVQLLNILFDQKTSSIGRMRALCNSVIVIDEVQSVSKKTLEMFSMALNFLSQHCNATILLSSATQPCFENLDFALKFHEPADIVRLDEQQKRVFARAELMNCVTPEGMDFQECTEFCCDLMEQSKSLLVICNTKSEARTLFLKMQEIAEERDWRLFHLSTGMCQKHRLDVLEDLQEKLKLVQKEQESGKKVICISTQLVEAGIDFSFESVVRILAGLDNLAQAAGRCNRSNEYQNTGKVYLIRLKNENLSMLEEIYEAQKSTERVLNEQDDQSHVQMEENEIYKFYQYFFAEMKKKTKYPIQDMGTTLYLTELLANKNVYADKEENRKYFFRQPFKTAAQKFRVFDEDTMDVIVPYGDGTKLIEKLKAAEKMTRDMYQEIKPYTISIFQYQKKKLEEYGMLEHLFDDRLLVLKSKAYCDDYGLEINSEPKVEDYIF
jgi:CRISPR-associated endonuclease/helicase Cas3